MNRFVTIPLLFGAFFLFAAEPNRCTAAESADDASVFAEVLPDLASADLNKMKESQQTLQNLCFRAGAPGSDAEKSELNALMTAQLDQPIDPVAKTWILFQLSRTAADSEVDAIAPLLADSDFRVRQQALRTLVAIRSDKALEAVRNAAQAADDAFKAEIEATLKVVSYDLTIPVETEWPLCLPYADESEVDSWLAGYDSFDVTAKARTVASLAVRGDRKYRGYVLEAVKSDDPDLRADGICALEKLGTDEDLPLLIELAKDPAVERFAIVAADRIEYPGFDEAVLEGLKNADNQDDFFNYTKVAVARHNADALAVIFDGAAKYPAIRANLLEWGAPLAKKSDLSRFIQLMLQVKNSADRQTLQKCVTKIADGDAQPVIDQVNDENRVALVPLIVRIGDENAFLFLYKLFTDGSFAERETAVRGLANLPDAQHAETLLTIAKDRQVSAAGRIAALRAYIRVISLPEDQIGIAITDQEKLAALKSAFNSADRDEERALVLDRVKAVRIPESLAFVLPYVDDPKFTEPATVSVLELAHHDFLRKEDRQAFADALKKVIEKNGKPEWVDEARRYLTAMEASR